MTPEQEKELRQMENDLSKLMQSKFLMILPEMTRRSIDDAIVMKIDEIELFKTECEYGKQFVIEELED